jgi:signal transduction histidine kinase
VSDGDLPPGFQEVQREALTKLFALSVTGRVLAMPIPAAVCLGIVIADGVRWRYGLFAVIAAAMVSVAVRGVRGRRRGATPEMILRDVATGASVQLLMVAVTGGLMSPLVVGVPPIAVVAAILYGRQRPALRVVAMQSLALWAMAALHLARIPADLVPRMFRGGAPPTRVYVVLVSTMWTLLLVFLSQVGLRLRAAYDQSLLRALTAREETLASFAEQTRLLTGLSAEIAHELKNPLTSIKGLSAMAAKGAQGRDAERLAVMRGEIERMSGILDEFLTFSRPLVPLALRETDLVALASEVAALHEGTCLARGLTLEVQAEGAVHAACDPRKVKQVLINVLQNAIAASPRGAGVVLALSYTDDGRARIAVEDRGRGLSDAVASRLFQPGVTDREDGSGLGLTIARGLARQHGGELTVGARAGGGCEAVLTLPAQGPAEAAGQRADRTEGRGGRDGGAERAARAAGGEE